MRKHAVVLAAGALLAGCANPPWASPSPFTATPSPSAAVVAAPEVAAPARASPSAAVAPAPAAAASPAGLPAIPAKVNAAVTKPAIKVAAAPAPRPVAPAAQPPKKEDRVAVAAKPATPPLDLKSLETRLRDTSAIGVMTKLALKNQVDDLLDQFREFYQGKLKTTLAELRQSYERLVLKVLALLQDADPPLANAVATSREAIWGILSDPAKFAAA